MDPAPSHGTRSTAASDGLAPGQASPFQAGPAEALGLARLITSAPGVYRVRSAASPDDIRAAQALRYEVFNLELQEGLEESAATGLDADPFDAVCDHLLVEHVPSQAVVGTYRMQTGRKAGERLGYYSAQEFDFSPLEPFRGELIELGRACVHQQHRNLQVLGLLWKGIAEYAQAHGSRYLCGCSSLTSQDAAVGAAAYEELRRNHLAPPQFRTKPLPQWECPLGTVAPQKPSIPKLLRAYLSLGATICGPPALDRQFKTIDFLTLLDLEGVAPSTRQRFLS